MSEIEQAYERGRRDMAQEVFALAEETRDKFHGKDADFDRGRMVEAKSIAKAIGAILPPKEDE
jgi:hypothetical protein